MGEMLFIMMLFCGILGVMGAISEIWESTLERLAPKVFKLLGWRVK